MKNTKQRSIVFTASQFAFLEKEAARLEITVADLVRRIIDQYREQRK
jgi:hypothetical protein